MGDGRRQRLEPVGEDGHMVRDPLLELRVVLRERLDRLAQLFRSLLVAGRELGGADARFDVAHPRRERVDAFVEAATVERGEPELRGIHWRLRRNLGAGSRGVPSTRAVRGPRNRLTCSGRLSERDRGGSLTRLRECAVSEKSARSRHPRVRASSIACLQGHGSAPGARWDVTRPDARGVWRGAGGQDTTCTDSCRGGHSDRRRQSPGLQARIASRCSDV